MTKRCAWKACHHTFTPEKPTQRYCSRSCACYARNARATDDWKRQRAEKGAAGSVQQRKAKAKAKWTALIAKVGTEAACKEAYLYGYQAGYRARRYVEVSEGRLQARARRAQAGQAA